MFYDMEQSLIYAYNAVLLNFSLQFPQFIDVIDKTIIFNTNGYTLNVTYDYDYVIYIGSGGEVDLDTTGGGSFNIISESGSHNAIIAQSGGRAVVTNVTAAGEYTSAVSALDPGSFVQVNGNITVTGTLTGGAFAQNGGTVAVNGNISINGDYGYGVGASNGSSVSVTGSITVTGNEIYGAYAFYGSTISIDGDISVTGTNCAGAFANTGCTVIVDGNVSVSGAGSTGAHAIDGGTVTINGTLSAPTERYVKLQDVFGTSGEFSAGTGTDEHYKIYTDGINTVRVKNNPPVPRTPVPSQNVSVNNTLTFTAVYIAEDEDNDALTITAMVTNPDPAIAEATLDNGIITVTGKTEGSTTIIVTVSDGVDTVDVTVDIIVSATPAAPYIIIQPAPQTVLESRTAEFTVVASGDSSLTYQWRRDGNALSDNDRISGATSPTLIINGVQASDAGNYSVVVTTTGGSVTSANTTLTVLEAVCEIDSTGYATLDDALLTIYDGDDKTIRLLKDIDYFGGIVVENKTITFQTNGYNLNITNNSFNALEVGDNGVVNLDTTGGGSLNVATGMDDRDAVWAHDGGKATVTSITATGNNVTGASARYGIIEVIGDITVSGEYCYGAYADEGSIYIGGNITVTGENSRGVYANNDTVEVAGNVSVSGPDSIGVMEWNGGTVIIHGKLTSPAIYIRLEESILAPADFVADTVNYPHYKVYTDGINTVVVKNNIPVKKASASVQSVAAGYATTFTASDIAQDEDNDTLAISVIVTDPDTAIAEASLDIASGTVTITGVTAGSTTMIVTVSDGVDTADILIDITVTELPVAPSITIGALPDGMINTAYSHILIASGNTPITWSIDSGSLPDGLTLSSDGVISGTSVVPGTFSFTVKATNSAGSDMKVFSIRINVPAYTITASAGSGGTITPRGSVSVQAGASQTFTISPYSNYVISSVIVDGVSQGAISSYTFYSVNADHTISATFSYIGSSSGGGTGGGGTKDGTKDDIKDDSEEDTEDGAQDDTKEDAPDTFREPDLPVIVSIDATVKVDSKGKAVVTVSYRSVIDAIAKALEEARKQGKADKGIVIMLDIDLPDTVTSLEISLPRTALIRLVNEGVRRFVINGRLATLSFDPEALKEIRGQSSGNVTITIKPAGKLSSAAGKLIGKRPVYDITISYIKSGKKVNITSLGKGGFILYIPYKPGDNETGVWLFGVYVDKDGNAIRIPFSFYDENSGCLVLMGDHFSVYGIGYKAPSKKYKDTADHWAKDSIDYISGLGLFEGILSKTFSPKKNISRGMLATLLGRLAGADVSEYEESSFSDVAADKYYMPYVEWACKEGIMTGISEDKFGLGKGVTRDDLAIILNNFIKAAGYDLPAVREAAVYTDDNRIGTPYEEAISTLQQSGIMMGYSDNSFKPKAYVSRAEMCVILHRLIKVVTDPASAQGWAMNDDGGYMYYEEGKALTGLHEIDGKEYYFNDKGILETE